MMFKVASSSRTRGVPRLDRLDSAWINQPTAPQTLGILLRYQIIRDDRQLHASLIENGYELLNQGRFSRPDRTTDPTRAAPGLSRDGSWLI